MTLGHEIGTKVGEALSSVRSGVDKLSWARVVTDDALPRLALASDWFENDGTLPVRCTADGEGAPPPLQWTAPPEEARSFVLICEDPDAPLPEPFVHWLLYDIPASARSLGGGDSAPGSEGKNSALRVGFTPPAPPPGHGLHHYHFQLFALDTTLGLDDGAGRGKVQDAMRGHVVAFGDLVGTYARG